LAIASHAELESYDLSSLRYIMWCATPVTPSVAEDATRRTGVGWLTAYGASELPVIACNSLGGGRLDSVGHPVTGAEVRIASLETGKPVRPGEVGEIQVRSESVMAGYLPGEASADAFCGGWYRTGDVGHIDGQGCLCITDRFQVAPVEIEAVLHGHPAVADCAVFGVPDAAHGEVVVAAVARNAPVGEDELSALVADRLASYKRLSRVVFVPEIPRLPSGKVLRRILKEQCDFSDG
jgi:acyl-CoA synthetase (AMP-forming)/AMP-acid ligase II